MRETVQSIDRALTLLSAIADRPDGLSGLARRIDIPTSTTGRLLATLEHAGTVTRAADGTYRIGPTIVALAQAAEPATQSLELAAQSHLADLADVSDEAAGLCLPIGDTIHCVAQVATPKPVQAEDWTGRSWPLHQGGSGLVVLATSSPARLTQYLAGRPEVDGASVRVRVERAASDGLCWSHGDYRDGLSSVAAPVVDAAAGEAVAALYVYGPSYRFPRSDVDADRLGQLLIDRARQLSALLGGGAA